MSINRASLNKLTKTQLVNKALNLDSQRRTAWREYYQCSDDLMDLLFPKLQIKKETKSEFPSDFVLKALLRVQSEENIFSCPVCLEVFSALTKNFDDEKKLITARGCGHIFCKTCNEEWGEEKPCPVCRN